jgi:integrase
VLGACNVAARRAGVTKEIAPHDVRRVCASILRASGVRIEVAMAILGHKNAAMLLEVYASALSEEAVTAAARFQQFLYGPPPAEGAAGDDSPTTVTP